ncbi:hypothetical protein BN59_03281 [Legionella massiliensis]|uniref:Uncharacterized protein n=1 Tax=Legionella massiliensis TaxID=1034943 RepID=A0A078L1A9_9GAMM|nr:hypothetical protein [Legionella massiliensis]CDZ78966.1 hypothetical protein BN59_03281 [Legionella massiliensis]CEE14704.1 hypothetical protein BN1094_03281 [Legionella massiliensis]
MKKHILPLALCSLFTSSYAFNADINLGNLDEKDLVSFHIVTGSCVPMVRCDSMGFDANGMPFHILPEFIRSLNVDYKQANLLEFGLAINGISYPSCQHLEVTHGGQNIRVTLSKTGCI